MPSENQNWTKKIFRNFEGFVEGVIYDRDLSISARLFGLFLYPFSHLFSVIVRTRVFLYGKRILLKDKPLDCFVLVVGNLTVGGTGKTPVVERFAKGERRRVLERIRGYATGRGRAFDEDPQASCSRGAVPRNTEIIR